MSPASRGSPRRLSGAAAAPDARTQPCGPRPSLRAAALPADRLAVIAPQQVLSDLRAPLLRFCRENLSITLRHFEELMSACPGAVKSTILFFSSRVVGSPLVRLSWPGCCSGPLWLCLLPLVVCAGQAVSRRALV